MPEIREGSGSQDNPQVDPGTVEASGDELILESDRMITAPLVAHEGQPEPAAATEERPLERVDEAPDSAATALIEVATGLQDLAAKQDGLRDLFEARLRSDELQAKALERLHDQVREYKANFIRQEMQPLLRDLIFCYDYAADEVERTNREATSPSPQETMRAFDHLRQMIADVLAKYDVEPYRSPGSDFDRREQQCVRTIPTAVEADEKKVAAVGAIGFRLADQIIRKEQVTVYKHTPAPAVAHREAQPAVDRY